MSNDTDLIAKMVALWNEETEETETEAMTRVLVLVRAESIRLGELAEAAVPVEGGGKP